VTVITDKTLTKRYTSPVHDPNAVREIERVLSAIPPHLTVDLREIMIFPPERASFYVNNGADGEYNANLRTVMVSAQPKLDTIAGIVAHEIGHHVADHVLTPADRVSLQQLLGARTEDWNEDFASCFGFVFSGRADLARKEYPASYDVIRRLIGTKTNQRAARKPKASRAAPRVLYFASGSNHAGEIKGFAEVGQHIGVAAPDCNRACEDALIKTPSHIHVFVDSGAFSEVVFGPDGPKVVDLITDGEWKRRLAKYQRLAAFLGPRLHVVAPDMIGNQEVTLERLRQYAPEMRSIAAYGPEVFAPLQRGRLSAAEFLREVERILGFEVVPAIPMKKNATSVAALAEFLRTVRPKRVHLLGLGEKNRNLDEVLAAAAAASPSTVVSLDANKITASVGRAEGKRRVLTAGTDHAQDELLVTRYGSPTDAGEIIDGPLLDYTDALGDLQSWVSPAQLRSIAKRVGLSVLDTAHFLRDPGGLLAELEDREPRGSTPAERSAERQLHSALEAEIEAAWAQYHQDATVKERKRRGVRHAFGRELREVTPTTLFEALHFVAREEMEAAFEAWRKSGKRATGEAREAELVEWLDARGVTIRHAIEQALHTRANVRTNPRGRR
jgi:hypothetical protein